VAQGRSSTTRGCLIVAAIFVAVPLLVVAVVGVKTWVPLEEAGDSLEELSRVLGSEASYRPLPSGEIPPERMELFLQIRDTVGIACAHYGEVQEGFDSVASLETKDPHDLGDVGGVVQDLGSASLAITPFLARFFRLRNAALLERRMGLEEYTYIYALAYHDTLLNELTLQEIFSDGLALSPAASQMLQGLLLRQEEVMQEDGGGPIPAAIVVAEAERMAEDPARLLWQDALPAPLAASIEPYRERLDRVFCPATAGLEMEANPRRALAVALE